MKSRPSARAEIALGLAVFAVYSVVSGLDWSGREAAARRHASTIVSLEQRLHLDIEPSLNNWLADRSWLRVLANYEYATTYVISAFALLLWLYVRRPEIYHWARTSFVWLNLLGVSCFALYPLAPPRLLAANYGFTDTVRQGKTWGSWGSPLVGHANQLAAMPSLHIAWAIWVSVVLARIHGGWRTQILSMVHVLVTAWVIMATGNHYLVDALAAVALVLVCVALTGPPDQVAAADAFFLHAESKQAPQHVGGVVLLDGVLGHEHAQRCLHEKLSLLPRFTQVLDERGSWRRPRWRAADSLDLDWHVPLIDLTQEDGLPAGRNALDSLVASLAQTPLPRDRPLWRFIVVHGLEPGRSAVVLLVHHVVSDGIGTVAQVSVLFEPSSFAERPTQPGPGLVRRAAATVLGLAQLARDLRPKVQLPSSPDSQRGFATVEVSLAEVQGLAKNLNTRVSDVLLTAVAEGLHCALPEPPSQLVVAVPLTMRDPQSSAEGNVTAAVVVEIPLGDLPVNERLAQITAGSARLRTPTRAIASQWVMRTAGVILPPVLHARFVRYSYGPKYFSGIVSNMPGANQQVRLLGREVRTVFPLLPLAPRVPWAVGTLGWNGVLCVSIAVDPALVDARALAVQISRAFDEMIGEQCYPKQGQLSV